MASSSDHGPFKLSATLTGHSQDVRGVLYPDPSTVLSCSRDTTATLWKRSTGWESHIVYQNAHEGFVSAIEHISQEDGEEYVVTGGRDTLIQLWAMRPDLSAPYAPRFTLAGHTANVCCLSVARKSRTLVSGSWDCTARVWRDRQVVHTLAGHTAAVWSVLALDDHGRPDEVLTAAADNLIFHWRAGKQANIFKGHTQAVRALVVLPDSGAGDVFFASASNDATIKLWSLSKGTCLSTLHGHDSFVYSLALIPSTGELVSSGEDRTVRIWDPASQTLKQTITLPAISIWSVAACPSNGDIVAGSSDSLVRLFTRSPSRLAPAAAIEAFEESVKASSVPSATVGDVKKSDLPGEEALRKPGTKEGQVLMVKNSATGAVEAHQWSTSDYKWVMVGTVVDGVGSSKRQLFEGREYDYVFDVDIKDGVPPLKLPYNASDNPYTVAQKWLAKHELPDTYVDQVVEFLDKNTGGVSIGSSNVGADPFTGAGSYRPGQGGGNAGPGAGGQAGLGGDPWTTRTPTTSLLPHRTPLSFTQANLAAVRSKVDQFNLEAAPAALSSDELGAVDGLIAYLSKPSGNAPPAETTTVLAKMLSWPEAKRFPALDLLRLLALSSLPVELLPSLVASASSAGTSPSKQAEVNGMLAVRAIANGLAGSNQVKELLAGRADEVVPAVERASAGVGKNGRVAAATVGLNYSVLLSNGQLPASAATALLGLLVKLADDEDPETVYRSLVAIGNVLLSKATGSLAVGTVKSASSKVQAAAKRVREDRIRAVAAELEAKASA